LKENFIAMVLVDSAVLPVSGISKVDIKNIQKISLLAAS